MKQTLVIVHTILLSLFSFIQFESAQAQCFPMGETIEFKNPSSVRSVSFDPVLWKKKYARLYTEKVEDLGHGKLSWGGGKALLMNRGGIQVLSLQGSDVEMAFQHGALLKDKISQGMLERMSGMTSGILTSLFGKTGMMRWFADFFVGYFYSDAMLNHIPHSFQEESFALSEGSGYPVEKIAQAFAAPETLMALAAEQIDSSYSWLAQNLIINACTSFAVWGDYTTNGEMIIGRNLDYPGNGYYDGNQHSVFYMNPIQGQKYVMITSSGVHTAGVTAINESGLFLALHLIPTKDINPKRLSSHILGSKVIRQARSLTEAIELLRAYGPTPTGWSFVIGDMNRHEVATVEFSGNHMAVRMTPREVGYHAQTNHYQVEGMKKFNLFINQSIKDDSLTREGRVKQFIFDNKQKFTPRTAASLLSDSVDTKEGKISGFGYTISSHINMTSVIAAPNRGVFYVANGYAPVSQNDYIEFPLPGRFNSHTFEWDVYEVIDNKQFQKDHPEIIQSQQYYIQAKKEFEEKNDTHAAWLLLSQIPDVKKAVQIIQRKVPVDSELNLNYLFIYAAMTLKDHTQNHYKRFKHAKDIYVLILSQKPVNQLRLLSHLMRAKIYGHWNVNGYRKKALSDLAVILDKKSGADQKLRAAADRMDFILRMTEAGEPSYRGYYFDTHKIALHMQYPDLLSY